MNLEVSWVLQFFTGRKLFNWFGELSEFSLIIECETLQRTFHYFRIPKASRINRKKVSSTIFVARASTVILMMNALSVPNIDVIMTSSITTI